LAERVANGIGVRVMLEQRAPTGIEMNQLSTNRVVLEQEAAKGIAVVHVKRNAQGQRAV
jgi:hypothetical protein